MFQRSLGLTALVLAVAVGPVQPHGHAAEDGDLADTASTGRLDVSLTIPGLVQITDLDDIDLGTFDGTAMSGADDVCVWATTPTYTLQAQGDGAAGAFTLRGASPGGGTVPYTVAWADSAGAGAGTTLAAGSVLTGLTTSAASADCNGGTNPNATVIIDVGATDLAAVAADTYTGTLTLTVEPE